jgi:hypothetical protein
MTCGGMVTHIEEPTVMIRRAWCDIMGLPAIVFLEGEFI